MTPRPNTKKLTLAQEAILACMIMQHKLHMSQTEEEPVLWFPSIYFVYQLGLYWQHYHNQLMADLDHKGWVFSTKIGGLNYWTLTQAAKVRRSEMLSPAQGSLIVRLEVAPF